jgi:hypothetical protein
MIGLLILVLRRLEERTNFCADFCTLAQVIDTDEIPSQLLEVSKFPPKSGVPRTTVIACFDSFFYHCWKEPCGGAGQWDQCSERLHFAEHDIRTVRPHCELHEFDPFFNRPFAVGT